MSRTISAYRSSPAIAPSILVAQAMISLEQFPCFIILQILRKMELRTWLLSRTTGSFIYNLVEENSHHFNFPCSLPNLVFLFGDFPQKCELFFDDMHGLHGLERIEISLSDAKVSLAGLRFNEITLLECPYGFDSDEPKSEEEENRSYQLYLLEKPNILNNMILPLLRFLKNRAKRAKIRASNDIIITILEATGCSQFYALTQELDKEEYPVWLDEPYLQEVNHLKISTYHCFCHSEKCIRRFEYFFVSNYFTFNDVASCQDDVRSILKNLAIGPPLPGPRSISLLRKHDTPFYEGMEFEALNHRILFKGKIGHTSFMGVKEISDFLVVLVEEKNYSALITMLYDANKQPYRINYRMELFTIFDPEKIVEFLMLRTLVLYPIDISVLLEDLKTGEDIGDVISKFLKRCYSGAFPLE